MTMRYRALGATGLEVSEIGFGTWAIGGPARLGDAVLGWGAGDDRQALAALEAAFEAGVNLFDTADIYGRGHSEELLGKAFRGKREQVVFATKVGNFEDEQGRWVKSFAAADLERALDESLRRLHSDHVDILLLHSPLPEAELSEEHIEALSRLRSAGKTRFIGISIGSLDHGERAAEAGWGDVIELPYSLLCPAAEDRVLPAARTAEMGVIVRSPLAAGFLTGKYQRDSAFPLDDWRAWRYPPRLRAEVHERVERLRSLERPERTLAQSAIRFCLRHGAVASVVVGARNPAQVRENVAASDAPDFEPDELALIATAHCPA